MYLRNRCHICSDCRGQQRSTATRNDEEEERGSDALVFTINNSQENGSKQSDIYYI